ncbi:MAG TPA: hypothetical protein VIH97_02025 [Candidatus Acidoferrales bacterium]
MSRLALTEIHEQAWFPKVMRDGLTDELQCAFKFGKIYEPIVPRLANALQATGEHRIVDLCSGAGGPWTWLRQSLAREMDSDRVEICLTDKFPNIAAFKREKEVSGGALTYSCESVDASKIPPELDGFRVLFTAFHHFSPDEATAILQDAVDNRRGIGVFEAARRRPTSIFLNTIMLFVGFLIVPFIRPFRASLLFWTYVIPVVPFVLWLDGVISCLRAYPPAELSELVSRVTTQDYIWDIGEVQGLIAPVTYLVGYPAPNR